MKYFSYLLPLILLSGCASENSTSSFASRLSAVEQVQIGMTRDQVRNIMGQPDDIQKQISETGAAEVWVYSNTVSSVSSREKLSRILAKVGAASRGEDPAEIENRYLKTDATSGRTKQKWIALGFLDGRLKLIKSQ